MELGVSQPSLVSVLFLLPKANLFFVCRLPPLPKRAKGAASPTYLTIFVVCLLAVPNAGAVLSAVPQKA